MYDFGSSDRAYYRSIGGDAYKRHGTNGRQFDYAEHNPYNQNTDQGWAWFEGWRNAWLEDTGLTLEGCRALFGEPRK